MEYRKGDNIYVDKYRKHATIDSIERKEGCRTIIVYKVNANGGAFDCRVLLDEAKLVSRPLALGDHVQRNNFKESFKVTYNDLQDLAWCTSDWTHVDAKGFRITIDVRALPIEIVEFRVLDLATNKTTNSTQRVESVKTKNGIQYVSFGPGYAFLRADEFVLSARPLFPNDVLIEPFESGGSITFKADLIVQNLEQRVAAGLRHQNGAAIDTTFNRPIAPAGGPPAWAVKTAEVSGLSNSKNLAFLLFRTDERVLKVAEARSEGRDINAFLLIAWGQDPKLKNVRAECEARAAAMCALPKQAP